MNDSKSADDLFPSRNQCITREEYERGQAAAKIKAEPIRSFHVCQASGVYELSVEVNTMIARGYQPWGEMTTENSYFYLPMVKR